MLSNTFKSSWKKKIEPINCFDNNFLNEKNKALEPLQFLLDSEEILSKKKINNNKFSLKNEKNKGKQKRKSLTESDLYDSNIIIIENVSNDESDPTTFNQIEKQVKKINKIIKKSKKFRHHSSKVQ